MDYNPQVYQFLPVLLSPNSSGHDIAKDRIQTTEIMTVTLLLEL